MYIFVDGDINSTPESLLVWDGYDRKDETVTECLATLNRIRYGYQLWAQKADLNKKLGKDVVDLLSEGRLKIYALLDTPGGHVREGNEAIWAMMYAPDSEAYITCQAYSMGAMIAERAVTRHAWEGGHMMWHLTSDVSINPEAPENVDKVTEQMNRISDFLYFNSKMPERDQLMQIVFDAMADKNRLDNIFYLSNQFLHQAGVIHYSHSSLQNMNSWLTVTSGVYHEEITRFFEISRDSADRYRKFCKQYDKYLKSLKGKIVKKPNKLYHQIRKEVRDEFEKRVEFERKILLR